MNRVGVVVTRRERLVAGRTFRKERVALLQDSGTRKGTSEWKEIDLYQVPKVPCLPG